MSPDRASGAEIAGKIVAQTQVLIDTDLQLRLSTLNLEFALYRANIVKTLNFILDKDGDKLSTESLQLMMLVFSEVTSRTEGNRKG